MLPNRILESATFSALTGTPTPSEPPKTLKPARFALGVNGHPPQLAYLEHRGVPYPDQINLVSGLNASWYRVDLDYLEGPGTDYSKFEHLIPYAKAKNVTLLPGLFIKLDRANLAKNHLTLADVYRMAYDGAFDVVSKFKSDIHFWELSNEEDGYALIHEGDVVPRMAGNGCLDGALVWHCGAPDGAHPNFYEDNRYAIAFNILKGLSDGVHAADPKAKTIVNFAGWLHVGFFQRLENDHLNYDIVGVHWYNNHGEITCPGGNPLEKCPEHLEHFNVISSLQSITRYKPLWVTEMGMYYDLGALDKMDAAQSTYLTTILSRYLSDPIKYPFQVVIPYELLDESYFIGSPEAHFGFFRATFDGSEYFLSTPKPSYSAVRDLFR